MSETQLGNNDTQGLDDDIDGELKDGVSSHKSSESVTSEVSTGGRSREGSAKNVDTDTDLELEEEKKSDFDLTGRALYLSVCKELGVIPVSYFMRHMQEPVLNMRHHGLGSSGARALAHPLMNNTSVLTLDLQDNWLEGEGGEYLAEMLKENCYISDLDLSENRLGSRGAAAISNMLTINITLKSINLAGNQISDSDAPALAEAFYENNRLKKFNLSHNCFAECGKILGHAIGENETIEDIDLSWNYFRKASLMEICDGIAGNCRLREVNLSMNGFDNAGAFGVAEILKKNNTITTLDISGNRIGPIGAVLIGKAIEVNDVLIRFKMANNPIGAEGAKAVLRGINNENSLVTTLDISGIEVDKEFRTLEQSLIREVTVLRAPVLSDYDIPIRKKPDKYLFGTPLSLVSSDMIMSLMKKYCEENDVNLYESLVYADKRKEGMLSSYDFIEAIQSAGVELSEKQGDNLTTFLEGLACEGMIDYSPLKGKQTAAAPTAD